MAVLAKVGLSLGDEKTDTEAAEENEQRAGPQKAPVPLTKAVKQ